MKVPSNIITTNLYTIGNEFINKNTYGDYQGYYYELNNKYFAGKEFNPNSIELLKKNSSEVNPLLINPATSIYGKLTKINLQQNKPKSVPFSPTNEDFEKNFLLRYFARKLNVIPTLIKEINELDFYKLSNDPLYQTIKIEYSFDITDQQIADFNKQMPGLGTYIKDYILPTSSDESLQA